MIAGGLDALEILAFFDDGAILHSGIQPWSFSPQSQGLRWLCKLLLSSLPAMGFQPELPPLINTTPQGTVRQDKFLWLLMDYNRIRDCCAGVPIQDIVFFRADAPTTAGPGHACKVFQAQYGVHRELVALKVGASAKAEVSNAL